MYADAVTLLPLALGLSELVVICRSTLNPFRGAGLGEAPPARVFVSHLVSLKPPVSFHPVANHQRAPS